MEEVRNKKLRHIKKKIANGRSTLSVIFKNENRLSSPIKRQRWQN